MAAAINAWVPEFALRIWSWLESRSRGHRATLGAEAEDVVRGRETDHLLGRRLWGRRKFMICTRPEVLADRGGQRRCHGLAQVAGRVEDVGRTHIGDQAVGLIEHTRLLRSVRVVVGRPAVDRRELVVGRVEGRMDTDARAALLVDNRHPRGERARYLADERRERRRSGHVNDGVRVRADPAARRSEAALGRRGAPGLGSRIGWRAALGVVSGIGCRVAGGVASRAGRAALEAASAPASTVDAGALGGRGHNPPSQVGSTPGRRARTCCRCMLPRRFRRSVAGAQVASARSTHRASLGSLVEAGNS